MLKKLLIVSSIFSGIVAEPKHSAGNDFQAQLDSVEKRLKEKESEAFRKKITTMLKGYEECMMPLLDHISGKKLMTYNDWRDGEVPLNDQGAKQKTAECLKGIINRVDQSGIMNKELENLIKAIKNRIEELEKVSSRGK